MAGSTPTKPSQSSQETLVRAKSLCDQGAYDGARELASRIPLGDAAYLNARLLVARTYMASDDYDALLKECQRLVSAFPKNAQCFQILGVACFQLHQLDDAETAFSRALDLNPKDRASTENLGIVLDQNGWQRESYSRLRQVLQQYGNLSRPGFLALVRNALLLGDRRLANDIVRKLDQATPKDPETLQLDARNAFAHNDTDGGLRILKSGLKQFPAHAGLLADQGVYVLSTGDTDRAGTLLRKAIHSDPHHSGAHYVLADMGGGVSDKTEDDRDQRLQQIQGAITDAAVPYLKKSELGFAAGKILDSLKRHDEAFQSYDKANQMVWARLSTNTDALLEEFRHAKEAYELVLSKHLSDVDPEAGQGMIYLVGMPRSGTTLLEQMLSGIADMTPGGETGEVATIVQQIPRILEKPGEGLDGLEHASGQDIRNISDKYYGQFRSQIKAGHWRTNKDMQLFLHLGLIRVLFPAAKIIHCRRNPIDTCVSAYFQFFKLYHQQFSFNLEALGRYYQAYRHLMAFWQAHLPADIMEFDYEDLTRNPESALKPVVDFCGMEWSDDILNHETSSKKVITASIWQVRQKINQNSVARWRRYENHLQPLIENLGEYADPQSRN